MGRLNRLPTKLIVGLAVLGAIILLLVPYKAVATTTWVSLDARSVGLRMTTAHPVHCRSAVLVGLPGLPRGPSMVPGTVDQARQIAQHDPCHQQNLLRIAAAAGLLVASAMLVVVRRRAVREPALLRMGLGLGIVLVVIGAVPYPRGELQGTGLLGNEYNLRGTWAFHATADPKGDVLPVILLVALSVVVWGTVVGSWWMLRVGQAGVEPDDESERSSDITRPAAALLAALGFAAAAALVLLPYQAQATHSSTTTCDPGVTAERCREMIGADASIAVDRDLAVVCPPALLFFGQPNDNIGRESPGGRSTVATTTNPCLPQSALRLAGGVGIVGLLWTTHHARRRGATLRSAATIPLVLLIGLVAIGSAPYERDGRTVSAAAVENGHSAADAAAYEEFTTTCGGILGNRYTTSTSLSYEDEVCSDTARGPRSLLLASIAAAGIVGLALALSRDRDRLSRQIDERVEDLV